MCGVRPEGMDARLYSREQRGLVVFIFSACSLCSPATGCPRPNPLFVCSTHVGRHVSFHGGTNAVINLSLSSQVANLFLASGGAIR